MAQKLKELSGLKGKKDYWGGEWFTSVDFIDTLK